MAQHSSFPVEVLTPDGEVFNDEVVQISTKTAVGSIGILAHHHPLLAMLDPTELRLYKSESDVVRMVQGEGYLQVQADGRVLILVDEAGDPALVEADLRLDGVPPVVDGLGPPADHVADRLDRHRRAQDLGPSAILRNAS